MSDLDKRGKWQVFLTTAASKQKKKLPPNVLESLANLIGDLEQDGPFRKSGRITAHWGKVKTSHSMRIIAILKTDAPRMWLVG